ncbi:hypothetical protein [Amycolatopsis regifaucium]|uniref:hypothetical protein n=1 Tax=Amycolatopsis regifaucium TaxID=546365 RepID=UPI001160C6F2|nr:hypothetical protein [Amycolatopsis regifaucium]
MLLNEFGTYYLADELGYFVDDALEEHADHSATRIVRFHSDLAAEVADLLQKMAADPAHPLFETIGKETLYDWNGDQDSWAKFQRLARRMSEGIAKGISG